MESAATLFNSPIEPMREIVAYEAIWQEPKTSFKSLSSMFASNPGSRPSNFVTEAKIKEFYDDIKHLLFSGSLEYKINILINGTIDYPSPLKDAKNPVEILYYAGNIDHLSTNCIAVVGSRKPSDDGLKRARRLVKLLVEDDFTIVSGLASGIDTMAHKTALETGGRTIAVIGTPLDHVYPKENKALQRLIADKHLLVSQVPFYRYRQQSINGNRLFFPERNKTMSALTMATIIVEASDTSGTLIQARAALYQGRKLFILDNCFQKKGLTWPMKFLEQGAIRVKNYEDIKNHLETKII